MRGLVRAVLMGWLLLGQWLVATGAWAALTISPSPSTDGSYTVSWTAPAVSSIDTKLYEKVGTGDYSLEGTYGSTTTSKAFSGKAAGTYSYKTQQCGTYFGSTTCWDSEGPTSVTVSDEPTPTPAPTASMSWDPTTVVSGESSTLTWSSTNATSCTINGNTRATSGSWTTTQTRTRTDTLVCTGPGGTTGSVTATLTVNPPAAETAPDKPAKPTLTPKDEELAVSWTAPDDNGSAITDYDVQYKRTSASSWSSHSFSGTGTSTTIDDLTNGIGYEVQVRAQNGGGESSWSASAKATPRGKPDAPARPTVTAGDEELEVEWTAPDDNGAAITRYSMHYKASGASSWTTHSLANAGTSTSTTIDDLTNGTTYLLQVRAHNAAGISAFSATARGTPRGKPARPARPTLSAGNEELEVEWTAPANNGAAITDYDVQYKRSSASSWTSHSFSGTGTSTTIDDLSNGAAYEVQVRAQNAAGESSWSPSATATPVATGLSMSVSPTPSTDGSYTVSWGVTRCFTVWNNQVCRTLQERVGSSGNWTAVSGIGTSATSYAFSGKTDGTTYYYRLVIGTGTTAVVVGGPVSVMVDEEEEEDDPPARPAAPTVATGTGQLTVSWTAPDDNGSAITGYEVQYKRNLASVTTWSKQTAAATATSATVGSLTNGLAYAVRVRAQNAGGWSDESDSATGTPLAAPAAPTGPSGSTGTHTLTWTAVTGAASYKVRSREGADDTGEWSTPVAVSGTSKAFADVAAGTWTYQVQACNAGGCGDWSAGKAVVVTAGLLRVSPTTSTNGSYTVSWTLARCFNSPVGGSQICMILQEREDDETTWSAISGIGNIATSHGFSGKAVGTYHYRLVIGTGTTAVVVGGPVSVTVSAPPPDAPATPTLTERDTELAVSWTAPADNGSAITGYEVQYKRNLTTVTTWSKQTAAATATSAVIGSLTNGLEYVVRVRAQNAGGWSDESGSATGTPRGKPAAPAAPTVSVGDGQLSVSWTAPDDNGAAITDYDVRYKQASASNWSNHPFTGTGTSTTITGLTNGVAYVVRVRAQNAAGESDWSPDGVPPDPPAKPAAPTLGEGDEQLTVSWTAPADNGSAITDYDVRYRQTSVSRWRNHAFTGTGTSTTIGSLTNDVEYEVQVLARNAGGPSAWSDSATGTPTSGVVAPAKPAAPTLDEGDGQLTVSWTAPADNGSAITRYEVQYKRNLDTVTRWDTQAAAASATSAVIGSLTNGLEYAVRVRAQNAGGWSDESGSTTGTPRGKPAKPAAPTLGEGDGQLTVSWTAPANNGAAISDYDVRYKQTSASSWRNHPFSGTGTSTTIGSLTNDVAYEVQVLARNAGGDSDWSDSATGTPTSDPVAPPVPAGLTGPAAGAVTDPYTISWNTATGATYYELREWLDDGSQPSDDDWTEYNTGSTTSKTFTGQESGSWDYRVRACNATGCSDWSATFTVVVPGSVPSAPGPIVTESTTVLSADELTSLDKIGTLPGEFRVAESGAATYSIPLTLVPGTAGVVPPLGLHYSSQRGNGLLGVGWTIDGLSAITRCRQTFAQDGTAQPLMFNDKDRFCLDGQRLLATSGTYGAPESQYKTEIDQFLTVTARNGSDGHPDYFEVKRKDGSVSRYGATSDDNSEHKVYPLTGNTASDNVLTWALQEVKDSAGNKIRYHYTRDEDGHRISKISYAYGSTSTPRAEVRFSYEARTDDTLGYLAGYKLQSTQRLNKITVHGAGTSGGLRALRNYRLHYESATMQASNVLSRLAGVKECAGSGSSVCLPETKFAWSAPAPLFKAAAAATLALNDESGWAPVDFTPADINGDGVTDLVWTEAKRTDHRIRYALADKANGALASEDFTGSVSELEYQDNYENSILRVHTEVVDYNADGRMDIIVYSKMAGLTKVHLAKPQTGGGWRLDSVGIDLEFTGRYRYADLDSDGLIDAYKLVAKNGENTLMPTGYNLQVPTAYNLEVRYLKPASGQAVTSDRYYDFGAAVTLPLPFTQLPADPPLHEGAPLVYPLWKLYEQADLPLADVDGDGRADLITWGSTWADIFGVGKIASRLEVFLQRDAGFVRYGGDDGIVLSSSSTPAHELPYGARVADLNQDGLSDLVYFVGNRYKKSKNNYQWTGNWHYRLSHGDGFTTATQLTSVAANAQAPRAPSLVDDNGDGYPDFLYHDVPNDELRVRRWSPAHGAFETSAPTRVRGTDDEDAELFFTVDMNGDGNGDLLHLPEASGDTETLKVYHHNTTGRAHLITAITNGLGAKTSVTYESLGATDNYVRIADLHSTPGREVCATWELAGRLRDLLGRLDADGDGDQYCWTVEEPMLQDAAAFYKALNDPWADPPEPEDPDDPPHPLKGSLTNPLINTAGEAPILELMGPLYVVTQVRSSAPTAGNVTATSGIGYVYARGKVQAAGRGLLGFRTLTTVDLQTGVRTTTTYRQDFPYIGLPLRTEVKTASDKLLRAAQNTWKLKGYDSARNVRTESSGKYMGTGSARLGTLQPYIETSVEEAYALPVTDDKGTPSTADDTVSEGALLSTVTTETDVDGYGNPTDITTVTEDHANNKRFRQVTDNTYGAESATWEKEYGRLTETTVTRERDEANDKTYERTGNRTSSFTYYTAAGATRGLLKTETRKAIMDKHGKVTIPAHTTTYSYDARGNRVRAKAQAGTATRCNVDTQEYDGFGRYVLTEKDCLNRTRRTLTYNAHGLPLTVAARLDKTTASALLTTTHTYTAGGRLTFTRDGTGAYTAALRASCAMNADCPTGAAFYDETRQPGNGTAQKYRTSRVYRDVLGRAVRNSVIGFNDGKWIHTDTEYDALGRVARRSEPYYAKAANTYWTSFEYDLLGRVVKTVLPDNTSTLNSEITVTYAGLTTTTTNAKGQTQRETRNALDEVIKTRDHAGTTVTNTYNAWGQVKKTVVAGTGVSAVTTTMTYDKRGRRTGMTDPDRGAIRYEYNALDELVKQTDARGHYQVMTYDGLGRMKTRKDYKPDGPDAGTDDDVTGEATWTWDGASNGLGQLQTVTDTKSGYTRALTYDSLGRVSETAVTPGTGADTYHEKQTYDGYGRPYQHFDAARTSQEWEDNVTEVKYNAYGYAYKWVDGVYENGNPKATYREITSQDARGNVTGEKLGGGALRTARTFDAKTGRIGTIRSTVGMVTERQEFGYTWDVLGNLTTRTDTTGATGADGTRDLTESFTYDTLNRLTSSQVGTGAKRTVTYDALGNIKTKTGVGSYLYGLGSTGPHAVSFAGNATFTYDAAGNLIRENRAGTNTRSLDYTPFNKVSRIVKGTHTVTFAYGPERARFKRTDTSGSNTTTTLYVGSVEKVTYSGSLYEYKRYIAGGAALITEKHATTVNNGVSTETESVTTQYLLKDHLGSVAVITNALGGVDQELSYDAWGQRRNAATWGDLTAMARMSFDNSRTTRGFTGHEMVDEVGIIHMNGRIYDPNLGRFMQADPVIQFPDFSQSHNRYSYVLNNPLNATDPSGYFLKKLFRKVVGFALNGIGEILFSKVPVLRQFSTLAYCLSGNPVHCGAAAAGNAYAGGASLKRALKAGVFAYVSAEAFTAVGDYFQGIDAAGGWGHFGAHALTGGILTELQGGEFGHGFLSAGVAFGVGQIGIKQGWSEEAQFVSRVVSAGTVSEVTGGKFANGAVTAAFAFVYNDLKHAGVQGDVDRRLTPEQEALADEGKVREFWESRLASGDPIAQLALDVLDNVGLGKVANDWLLMFDSQADFAQIRVDIMREHARITGRDADGWLRPDQIAGYHHAVFAEHGLSARAFGGTPVFGFRLESHLNWGRIRGYRYWCEGCEP